MPANYGIKNNTPQNYVEKRTQTPYLPSDGNYMGRVSDYYTRKYLERKTVIFPPYKPVEKGSKEYYKLEREDEIRKNYEENQKLIKMAKKAGIPERDIRPLDNLSNVTIDAKNHSMTRTNIFGHNKYTETYTYNNGKLQSIVMDDPRKHTERIADYKNTSYKDKNGRQHKADVKLTKTEINKEDNTKTVTVVYVSRDAEPYEVVISQTKV